MTKDTRIYTTKRLNKIKIIEHFNYLDRECVIVTKQGFYPCAYVELKGLKDNEVELDTDFLDKIEVHYEVNFCRSLEHLIDSNPNVSKELLNKIYIGWDYGHAGDYLEHILPSDDDTMHSLQEIEEECKSVVLQLNNMGR